MATRCVVTVTWHEGTDGWTVSADQWDEKGKLLTRYVFPVETPADFPVEAVKTAFEEAFPTLFGRSVIDPTRHGGQPLSKQA